MFISEIVYYECNYEWKTIFLVNIISLVRNIVMVL